MKRIYLTPETSAVLSKTIRIGVPVAIQSALVAILALADVLMVGNFGKEATAAVGLASKWHFVAIMIMAGLSTASSILVAQYWGKGERSTTKAVTLLAAKAGIWILIPVTTIFIVFSDNILNLQTRDIEVIALGSDYLLYASPVLILTHLVIVLESTLRSTGDSFSPLVIATITIIVNIALNYCLINGIYVIGPMGVAGAALATTISRATQIIIFFSYLGFKQHWLKSTNINNLDVEGLHKKYISLAIPAVSGAVLWAIGTMLYQVIFGHMGTLELAVFSTLGPFESLCFSLFFGLSVACSVIIGQHLGCAEFTDAKAISRLFTRAFAILGIATTVILLVFQPWFLSALGLDNPEYTSLSKPTITLLSIAVSLKMLNMVIINGILRAGGENKFCLQMDFIAMWMFGLPFTAIAAFILHLSFEQVYAMMLLEEVIKLTLCWRRYNKHLWLRDLTVSARV
ncbi:MATE family efflux transporter [Vibrio diazotrophicus]|jgi:putative MATE family efflux protein|uniref:Multidrug resistance protein NorM n=1 Tax=Vibrio diazotrophicus TaxID=685 RepID=A0A2J8HTB3_VIBDI|nr:MATE family efflux transporter [Vibrio diazotrophicus]PNI01524.1 MATE family efflux transporter [Vibrio diazotrophicus]RAS57178.1 putative MATE family efflux protein [Vibrio diazotrophicus]